MKRVSEMSNEEISSLLDEYMMKIKIDYQDEVFNGFKVEVKKLTQSELITEDVLIGYFNASTFKSLLDTHPEYVYEHEKDYWISHVVNQMNRLTDFEKLK